MAKPEQPRSAQSGRNRSLNGQQKPGGERPTAGKANKPLPSDKYAAGHDFLLANGSVDERLFSGILQAITDQQEPRNKSLVLILVTYGGVANDAYRIGKSLQHMYGDVSVFIPSFCKSAGTLIACSANTLVMNPFSELGPLDVQLLKRDELFERRSGLITSYALDELKVHSFELFEHFMLSIKNRGGSISFKMASEIAAKITADIMDNVYSHINVESIGEDARNLRVASEYCKRLDRKYNNLKNGGIEKLVHGYVSHDFVIDFEEARTLFNRVELPTATLFKIFGDNSRDMMVPLSNGRVVKMLTLSEGNNEIGDIEESTDGTQTETAASIAPNAENKPDKDP